MPTSPSLAAQEIFAAPRANARANTKVDPEKSYEPKGTQGQNAAAQRPRQRASTKALSVCTSQLNESVLRANRPSGARLAAPRGVGWPKGPLSHAVRLAAAFVPCVVPEFHSTRARGGHLLTWNPRPPNADQAPKAPQRTLRRGSLPPLLREEEFTQAVPGAQPHFESLLKAREPASRPWSERTKAQRLRALARATTAASD